MTPLTRFAAWLRLPARGRRERVAVVEECEQRILYSADLNPALWAGHGDAMTSSAIVRAVDEAPPQATQDSAASVQTQQEQRRHEIVFVDAAVPDAQNLIDGILAQRSDGADIEVVQLRTDADGLRQIADVLAGERGIDAVHIVSHGGPGLLRLGNGDVGLDTLQERDGELQRWSDALGADADILLYGCDVAAGDEGAAFIAQLAQAIGADVAASTDATGHESLGGDWQLESSTGTIDAELAVTAQLQQAWSNLLAIGVGATTTGTTTGSSLTVSHTTAAGADRLMLVGVSMREISSESVSSMTYNGRSLTFQGAVQAADGARVEIWSLLAPSVGTSNLVANLTGAGGGTNVAVMTFTGVDQTTPLGAFASALGDGNNGSATVSSATGELVFGAVAVKDVNQDLVPGPGQTERWDLFTGTEANGGGSTEAGAASVAMSWSWSAGTDWAIGGVSIKPATISVTPTAGLSTTEAGGTASFNVVLYSAPTNDVTIPVSSSDTSEGTVSTASLTFTAANWSTPQTVTVTGVDDTLADGFQPYTIVLNTASSTDAAYDNLNPADVQAANADNDINYGLITVNTTSDASDGDTSSLTALAANRGADDAISLREAIIAANNTANGVGGADRIHFNIAGAGPHTISLASALPTITGAVVVDASTEPDYTANTPVVRIDGASAGANVDGLTLSSTSDGSTIRGLMITRFTRDGIAIQSGADNITIAGNWIGTTGTSSTGVGNTDDGIDIAGSAAIIGGTGANDRNVITNSGDEGITIVGSGVTGHLIAGNYIGVDPDGASGGGNTDVGIAIISGSGNTIGGTSAAARNVISKNWEGIEVNTSNNTIQGNYIGTDATGALNRGNRLGDGIQIQGSAANIAVGGTTASAANLIAYNAGNGVGILAGTGHQVLGNAIHSNSGLGIDLGAAGLAANDANDVDGGANNLQNFPLLGSVAVNGSQVVIAGTLNSEASKTYRIEFFANTANDNEGQRYLGFTDVTTPAGAPYTVSFTATLTASVAAGEYITATATDPSNNTSEFSAQVIAASGMAIWTNNTGSPQHATWDGSGFGTASAPNSLGEWTHVQAVESPTRSEIIAVGVDASGVIRGELWNGSSWTAFSFNDIVDLATTGYQSFQIAYEQQSGDALLVWENGTTGSTSLSYRTWNGTAWSAAQTITTPVSGEAVQLRLAADPNSDSMVLAVTGTPLSNDYALVWNGSGWGNPVTLDTSTGIDGTEVHVAYEAHSGQALVVYDGDGTTNALNYRTWDGTSWSAQQSLTAPAGVAAASDVSFSVLASDPNSNRIALGVVSEPEIWLAVWDGDAWTSTLTATASAGSTTSLNVALAFEHDSGDLLAAYGKSGSNFVAFRSWTSAGGWSAETAADTNLNLGATPQALSLVADPNSNQLMLATRDSGNDVRYALWTGSAWSVALADSTTDAGGVYAMPMAFVWYDNNRTPVIGSTGWSVAETSTTAGTVASGDADGHTRTYAIVGGVDAAKFAIGSASGVLSFVSAPDFEAPTDVGGNNVYDVKVQVSDGQGGTDSQDISVTVTDVSGTLVVSTTADNTDSGIVGGNAAHTVEWLNANKGADGFVSLREAVIAANNSAGNDTINLAAGTYTLAIGGSGEDGSATGDLDVQTNITIAGAGIASTIISGGGIDRPIEVDGSGNLTLSDVTLTGGSVNNDGGGLLVEEAGGSATLTRVDITGNTITGGARIGGGIHNVGSLVMTDSLVHGNTATGSDGGGVSNLGTATLTRTSIYSNSARYGGGIHQLAGAMTVENATVSGNTASAEGGGIDVAAGTLTVRYSTVAANTASGGNGGGVMVRAGTLTALSSIFADNSSSTGGRDLHGTFTSQGFNIIEHNAGFTGAVGTDQLGTDPSLAALALDVASGQVVHALNAGSIAINMGGGAPPATDQRGVTRDASADVGAYERVNTAPVLDNTGTMSLTTITEDQTNNAGDLVSSIISSAGGDRITDANGDPEGIAITSLVSGNGSWEYSITGGASWAAIGTVTNASALLLRSTDRVRFVPNAASGTSASITFRAWDRNIGTAGTKVSTASNGGSTPFSLATEDAAIAVTEVNDAPVLAAIGNRSVNEGATLSFTASATDADLPGQTLSYSLDAASLALGMTINASTGAFTWTPSEAQGGLAPSVTVTVTDNGSGTLTDSETFTITVGDTNVAPVLAAIGNRSVNEGATLSFTASATDADLPSQTLSYSLDAASLALGMSINASSGAFSWTPSEAQGGTAPSVTITVTDNGTGNLFDSETFTITVGDTNVAPVLAAIGNRSVNEGATLAFTASATDADLPAQSLTYSLDAASLALGMSINASSGAFSWTPSEAQGGLAPAVTITVTDNGSGNLTDSETFTITVGDTNLAPVLAAIGNRSVNEGATLSFTASATDADLPSQTLSYSLDAASLALGMTINASTGAFTWTPSEAQGGLTPSVTVTVTDNGSGTLTDSETFTITVGDTNVAPVLAAIGNRSVNEGATLNFIASATDADLPSQTLSYSLDAASLALGMSINASSGAFSWTPSEAQGGLTPSVTITVTDNGSGNLTDSETFTITVGDTNVAPVLAAIGNRSVNEGATLSFTASATDADLPSQTLSYSLDAASLALGMSINASSGAFSWTPSEAQGGLTPSVTITVTDNGTGNLFDSETFTITVGDTNVAPVLAAIGNRSVNEGATLSFTASATDADLPSQTLSYSLDAASLALGMSINASSGAFSWTPSEAQGGTAPSVTITVTDNGTGNLFDSETFTITVGDTNVAPVLAAIGNRSVNEGATLAFTASATDADLPAQSLTYSLDAASLALGMSINASSGAFSWTPSEAQGGTAPSVTITVTDNGSGNLTDSETFTITVGDTNVAPVLAAIGNRSVNEGATLSFTASATDADLPSQTLSYSLDAASLALGMTINVSSGAFSWTPSEAQGGLTPSVTVTVTDNGSGNLTDSETFTITVGDTNVAPVLAAIGNRSVNEGATLNFIASATDADLPAQSLTYSLDAASLALGMSINASSGAFSWTPTEAQGGLTPSVTITVTDNGSGNLTDSETFTITVIEVNGAPSGAAVVTGATTEDQTLTADTSSIADADGLGAFSYQWQRNGSDIVGAIGSTFTLGDADVGANIRVLVSYSDGNGTAESLTSAAVGPVANVDDAPIVTSNGGGAAASIGGAENLSTVSTVTSTDIDGAAPSYSIAGGADAARFTIDATTGVLSFIAAPDFEAPTDADADNVYHVTVQVSDGSATDSQAIGIAIGNVNEAPSGIAPAGAAIDEQAPAGTLVASVSASDPDAGELFSFTLVSDAAGRFAVDASSGRVTVAPGAVLDFQTQPSFDLLVRVTDAGGLSIVRTLTVALRQLPAGSATPPTTAPPVVPTESPTFSTNRITRSTPEHGQDAAAPKPVPRSAGTSRPVSLDGELVRVSPATESDAAPAGGQARHDAQRPWLHLREREGVDGLALTVSLDGVPGAGGPSPLTNAALRLLTQTLRNAAIEAEPADGGETGGHRTPSTLIQFLQDPVRVAGVGFTAGFVWWLTRSGGLLTSMLMGVPAWRHLDLLPVVARRRNDDEDGDDDGPESEQAPTASGDLDDSALLDLFEAKPAPHPPRSPR